MAKRKALGKGLSALIPDADKPDDRDSPFFQCPVEVIEPNPHQPRQNFSPTELEEMVGSVRKNGIITPLLVNKTQSGYQLIAGERRWRAAQKAGLRRVPVVVRQVTPSESLELALIENIHRQDLNPIEEAAAYEKLLEETGITQDALAKRLSKNRSSITNLLRLLKLPIKIQQDVIDSSLSMGHARLLAGLKTSEDQWTLRNTIIKRGLSVRQSEALAKRGTGSTNKKVTESVKDHYLQSLEDNLKRSLGTKVEIRKRGKKGTVVLHFYSDDELDRLLELLG
jgi:ParB family chromosome partitioning protein